MEVPDWVGTASWVIVLVSSLWVFADARAIGVKRGQVKGLANMNPSSWFLGVLLLWPLAFPLYLSKRAEFKRVNGKTGGGGGALIGWVVYLGLMFVLVAPYFGLLRISTENLKEQVRESMESKYAELDPAKGKVVIQSFDLQREGSTDVYKGRVLLNVNGEVGTFDVDVNFDGEQISWQVKE